MAKNLVHLSFGITSMVVLFLVAVAPSNLPIIPKDTFAQKSVDTNNRILGQPIYSENGKITGPYTYIANGTLANIGNVTNNGFILTTPLASGLLYGEGQGVLTTKDGETATYTFQFVGSLAAGGQAPHGSWYIHTNSTGKMAALNNMVGITHSEIHDDGKFSTRVWEWK
jgi:hypothetical protein